jgi:hypothetical protein
MYVPVRARISAPFLAPLSTVAPKLVPPGEYRGAANDNACSNEQLVALFCASLGMVAR